MKFIKLLLIFIFFSLMIKITSAQEIVPHPSVQKNNPDIDVQIVLIFIGIIIFIGVLLAIRSYFINKAIERVLYGKYPTIK